MTGSDNMKKALKVAAVWLLMATFALTACAAELTTTGPGTGVVEAEETVTPLPSTAVVVEPTTASVIATAEPGATESGGEEPGSVGALALDEQAAYYISRLPRPSDVPAGWRMDRTPQFEERAPAPGETYRFACEELPARSIGQATVGYRSLDALPSMTIEYVVYASDEDAAAALAEMRAATETCEQFALSGQAGDPPDAAFLPLDFPSFGGDSFGAALTTDTAATGSLLTHVIKIQSGPVVVGINHANWGDQPPPEAAVTEAMARLTLDYLAVQD